MNIFRHKAIFFTFLIFFSKILSTYAQPTVEWDKTYGGKGYETLNNALKTEDEGFLLMGSTSSPISGEVTQGGKGEDFWLVRIDANGNKLWDKRYSSGDNDLKDICFSGIQNADGYLLIGEKNNEIKNWNGDILDGDSDIWVVQIRPDGSKIWEKSYGGKGDDIGFSIVKLPDGDYILGGHTESESDGLNKTAQAKGKRDIWLIRIKPNGDKVWDNSYGGSENDEYPTGLTLTKDGNVVFAVGTASSQSGDRKAKSYGSKDNWVVKVAPTTGSIIWEKGYGGEDVEEVSSILELTDGSLVVCGSSKSSNKFGL